MSHRIQSFKEFYPFYLTEHQNTTSRVLHFIGTSLFFILLIVAIINRWGWQWVFLPMAGYGFAWMAISFLKKINRLLFSTRFGVYYQILSFISRSSLGKNHLIRQKIIN